MPTELPANSSQRLLSLDFLRGFIMVLLALESTGLYGYLIAASEGGTLQGVFLQFTHHPWHGLRLWDLVQPSFMFIAGTALALSLHRQEHQGMRWSASFRKTLRRCFWLFFWGVLDYAVRGHHLSFELWDVLTQLSFTTLVAFLIFRWPAGWQIACCAGLLLLAEGLYRLTRIPGFEMPFTDQHNFGNYVDLLLMNKINPDGWVAINCLPTAVHTIAGALAGKLLLTNKNPLRWILGWGFVCLLLGYGLDASGITPIIKRIATSSFTLASLGWCLLELAWCYWWIDILRHRRGLQFFTIVGMNSLFIYLFFEIVGDRWFTEYGLVITANLMSFAGVPHVPRMIVASLCVFAAEWLLCYFLYRKKIFFKL
jgi:predicted acyltransferase